ncbi:MAG: hypothetical protein ACTSUE_00665 [Promethearchaeota archaeon]
MSTVQENLPDRSFNSSLASFGRKLKKIKYSDILRAGMVLYAFYFFLPRLATHVMLQVHGVLFSFVAFYWLVDGLLLATALLYAWKHKSVFGNVMMLGALIYMAYATTRFFVTEIIMLNIGSVVASGIMAGLALLNLVEIIRYLFAYLFSPKLKRKLRSLRTDQVLATWIMAAVIIGFFITWISLGIADAFPVVFISTVFIGFIVLVLGLMVKIKDRAYKWVAVGAIAWLGVTCGSYFGFGQTYLVEDPGQAEFSYAFWGSPSGGLGYHDSSNFTWYGTPDMDEELAKFASLNATFYNTINVITLTTGNLTNYELTLREWESYNLSFIFDLTPLNNETGTPQGDFVTYWYVDQVNETVQALMNWLEPLNFTNFRGISLDVEGPNHGEHQSISRDQYNYAVGAYQQILDDFKARFPNSTTNLIQMEGIMFDFYDGDHTLDIGQRTVSTELEWDWYGFMTYHVGTSPSTSPYNYLYYLQTGKEQFGNQFQPWVGWWYEPDSIEVPGVYEQTLEHVRIAKSTGVREVVLAPVRNFIQSHEHNHTKIMARLNDLEDIKNGFESFRIPIHQNMRLLNDWDLYWDKIVPSYLISNNNVLNDLMEGTPGGWFQWIQAALLIATVVVLLWIYNKRHE